MDDTFQFIDDATRVRLLVTISLDSRWTRGPARLRLSEEKWHKSLPAVEHTDVAGHRQLRVAIGRRREKRWVAVCTCLAAKATRFEIAAALSTDDAYLVCVRKFGHGRGTPHRILCDRWTNFVGARQKLAKEEGFLDAAVMQLELGTMGIHLRMNCPENPGAGSVWRRMVQTMTLILSVTLQYEVPSTRKQWRFARELSRHHWRQWLPELMRRVASVETGKDGRVGTGEDKTKDGIINGQWHGWRLSVGGC